MTGEQLRKLYLDTERGVFTPLYEYDDYDQETDTYTGLVIIKTAQEVYAEWLHNLNNPPKQPLTEVEALQQENKLLKAQVEALNATTDLHEECLAEMAAIVYA